MWINTTTLLQRYNFAGYLLSGEIPGAADAAPVAKGPRRRFRLDRFGKPIHELNTMFGPNIAADAPKTASRDTISGCWAAVASTTLTEVPEARTEVCSRPR